MRPTEEQIAARAAGGGVTLSRKRGPHDLPPPLRGYYYRCRNGTVTVPVISVPAAEQGKGHVSRWLDALPTDTRIEFRCVVNPILRASLAKRGFRPVSIPVPEMGCTDDDAWVRL